MERSPRRWSQAIRSGAWQDNKRPQEKNSTENFILDVGRNVFPERTVRQGQRLPRETVEVLALEVFQTQ